jgi:hypothetical protein
MEDWEREEEGSWPRLRMRGGVFWEFGEMERLERVGMRCVGGVCCCVVVAGEGEACFVVGDLNIPRRALRWSAFWGMTPMPASSLGLTTGPGPVWWWRFEGFVGAVGGGLVYDGTASWPRWAWTGGAAW